MIIVELIGIPGCGKTTTLHSALSYSRDSGEGKVEIIFLNKVFPGIITLTIKSLMSYIKHYKSVRNYCRKWVNIVKCVEGVKWCIKYKIGLFELLQFLYFYDKIKRLKKANAILVTDQWVFQHVFSVFHDNTINGRAKECIEEIMCEVEALFNNHYNVIRCNCSTNTIISHLQTRNDGKSVIDGLDEIELKRIIDIQQINLNTTYEILPQINKNGMEINGGIEEMGIQMNKIIYKFYG